MSFMTTPPCTKPAELASVGPIQCTSTLRESATVRASTRHYARRNLHSSSDRGVRMPGMGGRMSTVIKAKISRLLDRAEDPGETLDYSYQKQLESLQNVKKGIADVVTAKKRLQMQSKKLEELRGQARHAGPPGALGRQRGPRARRPGAQERRPDRAAVARPAGRRARVPAGEAHRVRAEAAHEDRVLPHQEGGHEGAVLGRRGAGAHLRGRDRSRRADGRRRARHAARGRQDRADARAGRRRRRARGGRHLRRPHRPSGAPARTTSTASSRSSRARPRSTTSWPR